MTPISHHIPDEQIDAFVAGSLPQAFAVVVAAHLSMCDACRARSEAVEMLGGALLDRLEPARMSEHARARTMAALDVVVPSTKAIGRSGIYPAPVVEALHRQPPKWRMLGGGIRQQILLSEKSGSLRLLYIPAGQSVPEHGHGGLELTLVLQGSFADSEGRFGVGDVETAHGEIEHQPVAGQGEPCICLAATDAPLRFRSLLPRMLQPIFRI